MAAAGFLATPEHKVPVLWEIVAYVIITVAEICISVSGLELAFTAAPKAMKSFVTACWLLTVFFGNIFNAQITQFYGKIPPGVLRPAEPDDDPGGPAFYFIARRFNREAARWDVEQVTGEPARLRQPFARGPAPVGLGPVASRATRSSRRAAPSQRSM